MTFIRKKGRKELLLETTHKEKPLIFKNQKNKLDYKSIYVKISNHVTKSNLPKTHFGNQVSES